MGKWHLERWQMQYNCNMYVCKSLSYPPFYYGKIYNNIYHLYHFSVQADIIQDITLCSCHCHLFAKHSWYFKTESQLSWSNNSSPPSHPATTLFLWVWHSIQHEANSTAFVRWDFFFLLNCIVKVHVCWSVVRMSFLLYHWLLVHVMYVVYFAYAFVCRHLGLATQICCE